MVRSRNSNASGEMEVGVSSTRPICEKSFTVSGGAVQSVSETSGNGGHAFESGERLAYAPRGIT